MVDTVLRDIPHFVYFPNMRTDHDRHDMRVHEKMLKRWRNIFWKTFRGDEEDLNGPVFADDHSPKKRNVDNRKNGNVDIDPDIATSVVDVDITTLIRVGVFSMYLERNLSVLRLFVQQGERACDCKRISITVLHRTRVCISHDHCVCFLACPCSLITAMSVAWGYYESLLLIDESASNFLVRAPFWLTPMSLLWLQVRGGTADFCGEDAVPDHDTCCNCCW